MPEHPTAEQPVKEHPVKERPARENPAEHPTKEHPGREITLDELSRAIEQYVKEDSTMKGGYFSVYDRIDKRPLALTLEKVHKEKLAKISEDTYFACADFRSTERRLYDLDMFVKASDAGMRVVEVDIHKEEGKPRYGWVEEGGIWKKR